MADPHPDADSAPPVAICCAASDEAAVREAGESLAARGHEVQVAVGVDADHEVLTRAIAAQQGRGLFVLCRSHALDRNAVDQLREILRAHDVPFGRTLTLAVDSQRPREVEERIVSVLRRMVTGRADGRPRTWGSTVPAQEEDPDTTIRRPGAAPAKADPAALLVGLGTEPENADPYASTSQIEMQARRMEVMPPAYTGADHTAVAAAPRPPTTGSGATLPAPSGMPSPMPAAPSVVPSPMPAAPSMMPPPGAMPTPPSPMPAAPTAMSSPAPSDSDAGSSPKLSPPMPPMGPMGPMAPMGPSSSFSESMGGYTPAPVSAGADESSADFEPPLTVGGRMGRALSSPAGLAVVLGGLAVILVVVLAASLLGEGDGDEGQAASATATPAAKDAAAEAKADAAKADAAKADAAKAEGGAEAEGEPAGDAAEPSGDPAAEAEADPGPDDDDPPTAAAADPGDPPPLPARTFDPEDDPPEVVEALRNREVRAIDVFVVAPERKGTLTFDQAVEHCRELEVAGLRGWRVPTIGELNSVASAKMLGKSIYWSSTPGDSFGDLMLVLNAKKDSISVVTRGWDGARIVCIRPRQA